MEEAQFAEIGQTVAVSGWGYSDIFNRNLSVIKKRTTAILVHNSECEEEFKNTTVDVSERVICVRQINSSLDVTCQGDSGGPVMVQHKNQWHVEGIIATGSSGCGPGTLTVNPKISQYLDWILTNIHK